MVVYHDSNKEPKEIVTLLYYLRLVKIFSLEITTHDTLIVCLVFQTVPRCAVAEQSVGIERRKYLPQTSSKVYFSFSTQAASLSPVS